MRKYSIFFLLEYSGAPDLSIRYRILICGLFLCLSVCDEQTVSQTLLCRVSDFGIALQSECRRRRSDVKLFVFAVKGRMFAFR